jgi:hypothetical protein
MEPIAKIVLVSKDFFNPSNFMISEISGHIKKDHIISSFLMGVNIVKFSAQTPLRRFPEELFSQRRVKVEDSILNFSSEPFEN